MDVQTLISEKGFRIILDPVVSIKQRAVLGFRARALMEETTLAALQEEASRRNLSVELDRALRQKALESFRAVPPAPGLLLFLGFDTAILDQGVVGSGRLLNQVREAGLSPEGIVIEISESAARDTGALRRFVDMYRGHGFLIALSDVGAGHSNLERIALARPDVLTLGGALVSGIHHDHVRREIFKALMTLSHKIGSLVVAADVATEEDALSTLEMGVDMVAGSYWGDAGEALVGRVAGLAAKFKTYSVEKNKAQAARNRDQDRMMSALVRNITADPPANLDERLRSLIKENPALECIFVLDEDGLQITDTICPEGSTFKANSLFRPARKGADHSLKDYFYLLTDTFVNLYRTEAYVSQASGHLCVTLSGLFKDARQKSYVLCADVPIL